MLVCPGWIFFFFQAEDGIRDHCVTGVQTCALPISLLGLAGRTIGAGAALSPDAYGVPGHTGVCASTATTHGDQDRSRLTAASGMACQLGGDDLPPADACDLLAVRWCTLRESPSGTRS